MTFDDRNSHWAGVTWSLILAAGMCLGCCGCSSLPGVGSGLSDPVSRFSGKPGSKAGTKAFEERVEADRFPTAAEAGV